MALLSSQFLIYCHSLYWLTVAYFLLTSPATLQDLAPVYLLGEAMEIVSLNFSAS